ncbi:MAG: porin [Nitrospinae bacterium]|nr:porin [Nitrospinota bacterium]
MFKIARQSVLVFIFVLGLAQIAVAEDAPAPAAATPAAPAADPAPSPKWYETVAVGGMVDAYYSYNGNGFRGTGDNQYLGFAGDSNEFSVALFELNFEKKPTTEHPAGFYVGLMEGTAAQIVDAVSDKSPFLGVLRQAYGSLLLAPYLQLDVGKYATLFGAEVIESNANWNYTRSILFSYAIPFTHTGARLTYTPNDMFYAQLHVVNGHNNVVNHTSGKGVGGQIGITPIKSLPIVLNYMADSESAAANAAGPLPNIGSRSLFDAVVTFDATASLSFRVNYDSGSQSNGSATGGTATWTGVAGYARYALSTPFLSAIALRYESFNDADGFATGIKQTLNEGTITLEKAVDSALLRLDVRQDSSDQQVFTVSDGSTSKSQTTVTFGAVFTF